MDGLMLAGSTPIPLNLTTQITTMVILDLMSPGLNFTTLDPAMEESWNRTTRAVNGTRTDVNTAVETETDKTMSMLETMTARINITTEEPIMEQEKEESKTVGNETRTEIRNMDNERERENELMNTTKLDPTVELDEDKRKPLLDNNTGTNATNTTIEREGDKLTTMLMLMNTGVNATSIISTVETEPLSEETTNVTKTVIKRKRDKPVTTLKFMNTGINATTTNPTEEQEKHKKKTAAESEIETNFENKMIEQERDKRRTFEILVGSKRNATNDTNNRAGRKGGVLREGGGGGGEGETGGGGGGGGEGGGGGGGGGGGEGGGGGGDDALVPASDDDTMLYVGIGAAVVGGLLLIMTLVAVLDLFKCFG